MRAGLTASPWADTASPVARMLRAALTPRSWSLPQSAQVYPRTSSGVVAAVWLQRLLDGSLRSTATSVRLYRHAFYPSGRRNSSQPATLTDLTRSRFRSISRTVTGSTTVTRLSMSNGVQNWCRKSVPVLAIAPCNCATKRCALRGSLIPEASCRAGAAAVPRACARRWARRSSRRWKFGWMLGAYPGISPAPYRAHSYPPPRERERFHGAN